MVTLWLINYSYFPYVLWNVNGIGYAFLIVHWCVTIVITWVCHPGKCTCLCVIISILYLMSLCDHHDCVYVVMPPCTTCNHFPIIILYHMSLCHHDNSIPHIIMSPSQFCTTGNHITNIIQYKLFCHHLYSVPLVATPPTLFCTTCCDATIFILYHMSPW